MKQQLVLSSTSNFCLLKASLKNFDLSFFLSCLETLGERKMTNVLPQPLFYKMKTVKILKTLQTQTMCTSQPPSHILKIRCQQRVFFFPSPLKRLTKHSFSLHSSDCLANMHLVAKWDHKPKCNSESSHNLRVASI